MTSTLVTWKPFSAFDMTEAETADVVGWACRQIGWVCGWNVYFLPHERYGLGDFRIRGRNTDKWAGRAPGSRVVYISTKRRMTGQNHRKLGGIILHELMHLNAKPSPNWQHVIPLEHASPDDNFRHYLMHPYGSKTNWFAPAEVKELQRLYGAPIIPFTEQTIWPIWYLRMMRARRENKALWNRRLRDERQRWAEFL